MKQQNFVLFSLLLLLLGSARNAHSQQLWETQTYTDSFYTIPYGGYAIATDANQNVFVTGNVAGNLVNGRHTTDIATIKYDSTGKLLWSVSYNGPGQDNDFGVSIAVDKSGNIYVAGTSWGGITAQGGTEYDWVVLKYDTTGKQLWAQRLNGAENANDYATSLKLDSQGNVIVTGVTTKQWHYHITTAKWNSSGTLLWSQVFNGFSNGDDATNGLAIDSNDNILVAGNISEGDVSKGGGGTRWAILKYSSAGTQQWVYYHGGRARANDSANTIVTDRHNNVIVTGYQADSFDSNNNPIDEYTTLKLDTNGKSIWGVKDALSGNTNCTSNAVAVDGNDNIYITGMQGAYGDPNSEKIATEKYNPNGVSQWVNVYSFFGSIGEASWGVGLVVNTTGDVYVTGVATVVYNVNFYPDIQNKAIEALIKYNANGNQQWVQVTPNPDQLGGLLTNYYTEIVRAIILNSSGNVITTGVYNDATPSVHKSYFDTVTWAQ